MHIACWKSQATETHSEYVKIIACFYGKKKSPLKVRL